MANKAYDETAIQAIANAIRAKNETTDTYTVAQMAAAIEAIESGGGILFKTGTVTFADAQSNYTFVADEPDLFVCYIEPPLKDTTSSQQPDPIGAAYIGSVPYIWAFIQYKKIWYYYSSRKTRMMRTIGYNKGTSKLYASHCSGPSTLGHFATGDFNSVLGPLTYRWFAFYGVTIP